MLGIHTTLAAATKIPEFDLDASEAKEIAKAYSDVAAHYPSVTLDPKYVSVLNLGAVLSITYGARIAAYRMRIAAERHERAANTVVPIRPVPPPQPAQGVAPEKPPEPVPDDIRKGEIPGVGTIEFPPDHPLMGGNGSRRH